MQLTSQEIATLLQNSLSSDNKHREEASAYLNNFYENNCDAFILSLFQCYFDNNVDLYVRKSAGLAIKNTLISRERRGPTQLALNEKWKMLSLDTRNYVKSFVSHSISLENPSLTTTTSQIIAAFAYHEIPVNGWPELLPHLLELSSICTSSVIKRTCIETLGYISELVSPTHLCKFSSQFLTVIIGNMSSYQVDVELASVSCKALLNSVSFINSNFEREVERDCIMSTLFSLAAISISSHDPALIDLSCLAWETIVKIIQHYYSHIEKYFLLEDTLELCRRSIASDHVNISLQALEIWSSLSEIEDELHKNPREGIVCLSITEKCFPFICTSILKRLYHSQESVEVDQDEWVPQMAASTCLSLVCSCLGSTVLCNKDIVEFIQNGMLSPLWNHKEASLMAFGSLLEISQKDMLDVAVQDMLPTLLHIVDTESLEIVLDSATWVLGKIFDYFHHLVPTDSLGSIIRILCKLVLSREADVVNNCCWALMNLVIQYGTGEDEDELISKYPLDPNPASPYIREILSTLLKITSREDIDVSNVATAVFQCAYSVIDTSDFDNIEVVQEICQFIVNLLQAENFHSQASSPTHYTKMICGYFLLLQACFKKLGRTKIVYLFPTIISISASILDQYSNQVIEEVLPCMSVLVVKEPSEFLNHWKIFYAFIEKIFQSEYDDSALSACFEFMDEVVQKVGDGVASMEYHQLLFKLALPNLPMKKFTSSLLCKIIQYVGDIALFSPSLFSAYNAKFISSLTNCTIELSKYIEHNSDEESMEIIIQLSMQALSCVFQCCNSYETRIAVYSGLHHFLQFIEQSLGYMSNLNDIYCLRAIYGLLGDIYAAFSKECATMLIEYKLVDSAINSSIYDDDDEIKRLRKWVRSMIQ